MTNNAKGESKLKYTDLVDSKNFVVETKLKSTFVNDKDGVISTIFLANAGYRVHSQIGAGIIKVHNIDGWDQYDYNFNDGNFHTVRYECVITDNGGTYKLFVDGTFVGEGTMNKMDGKRVELLNNPVAETGTMVTTFDYVKYAALDYVPETPENPDFGGDNNDNTDSPDTGVVFLPVALTAVTAFAGILVSKKRR
jgi:hypothetical protein